MEDKSWIKLHRKFLQSPIMKYAVQAKMYHLVSFWCYLLLSVNWEEKKWYDGKQETNIPPGSLITSLQHLSDNTGLSLQQVRTSLGHYENMGMITRKTTNKWTQVWIVNWAKYQMEDNSNNIQNNNPITNEQQTDNKRITTTKEYKNIRSKDKRVTTPTQYSSLKDIGETEFAMIADTYKVSLPFVRSCYDTLVNYCESKGKTYRNYLAALRNFVKQDAIRLAQNQKRGGYVDATNV